MGCQPAADTSVAVISDFGDYLGALPAHASRDGGALTANFTVIFNSQTESIFSVTGHLLNSSLEKVA